MISDTIDVTLIVDTALFDRTHARGGKVQLRLALPVELGPAAKVAFERCHLSGREYARIHDRGLEYPIRILGVVGH